MSPKQIEKDGLLWVRYHLPEDVWGGEEDNPEFLLAMEHAADLNAMGQRLHKRVNWAAYVRAKHELPAVKDFLEYLSRQTSIRVTGFPLGLDKKVRSDKGVLRHFGKIVLADWEGNGAFVGLIPRYQIGEGKVFDLYRFGAVQYCFQGGAVRQRQYEQALWDLGSKYRNDSTVAYLVADSNVLIGKFRQRG